MTDLHTVRAALAVDEPDQDVVDRSRHRLQNRMNGGPGPRRRIPWLAIGTGLTATAVAAAVAIAVIPGTPAGPSGPLTQAVTGQDILLAAATAAEQAPEASGTYWHLTITDVRDDGTDTYDTWTKPDGDTWFRGAKSEGSLVHLGATTTKPFSLLGVDLTLDELRALPTDPDKLTAWLTEALKHSKARTSAGPLKDQPKFLEEARLDSLIALVSTLPAPPALRATAFRAIAAYPGVETLGAVPGGQGLRLPDDGPRLVVDPATGLVNGTSIYVQGSGIVTMGENSTAKITGEWTDTLPQ